MKLRSVWIDGYRNLQDLTITFPSDAQTPIHLIVGVNGTGKTGLLRALAHLFTALEYNQAPHLRFRLSYQLGLGGDNYEISIEGDGSGTVAGVKFEVTNPQGETAPRERGEWPNFLPTRTIIYFVGITNRRALHTGDSIQLLTAVELANRARREITFITSDERLAKIVRDLDPFQPYLKALYLAPLLASSP